MKNSFSCSAYWVIAAGINTALFICSLVFQIDLIAFIFGIAFRSSYISFGFVILFALEMLVIYRSVRKVEFKKISEELKGLL